MYLQENQIERRCLPNTELRFDNNGESPKIVGYAARFNEWTDIGGMFREKIAPGAFRKTLKESDIRALVNHDPNYVLGRNKSGTLRLREDDKGLKVEIDPSDTTWGNDLLKSMKRGDINQMSFGFTVNKADDDYNENTRILRDVTLFDVSVVTFPAYPTTTAEVRSAFQKHPKQQEPETGPIDQIIEKLRGKQQLTIEERNVLEPYLPDLSKPPAKHSETEPEPPAKHSDVTDTRAAKEDPTKKLMAKARTIIKPKLKK